MTPRGVSYIPYSHDLSHPGDRRRIKVWSQEYGVPVNHQFVNPKDLLILTAAAKLKNWTIRHKGPVVIDLVDGYLSSKAPIIEDILRNTLRSATAKSSFSSLTFSNELKIAISRASAVVVSCPEQAENIRLVNENVHCILDDHSELIPDEINKNAHNKEQFTILWEGQGHTLKHLTKIAETVEEFLISRQAKLIVVTNKSFKKYGSKFGNVEVASLLRRKFRNSWEHIELIDWSVVNLKRVSLRADLAIIPINAKDNFAMAKPENKLLSFWTMGMPVLCSPTPAYKRVLCTIGQEIFLVEDSGWGTSLHAFYEAHKRDSRDFLKLQKVKHSYLTKFHTRKILANKWEAVLRPFI